MKDKHIGEQIKKFREIKGYTQENFALKVGLSTNYISAVECGIKSPSLETIIKIINSLGVSADEIFLNLINNTFPIKSTILSNEIKKLTLEEQNFIFAVVDTMINEYKKT